MPTQSFPTSATLRYVSVPALVKRRAQESAALKQAAGVMRQMASATPFADNITPVGDLRPTKLFDKSKLNGGPLWWFQNKARVFNRAKIYATWMQLYFSLSIADKLPVKMTELAESDLGKRKFSSEMSETKAEDFAFGTGALMAVKKMPGGYRVRMPIVAIGRDRWLPTLLTLMRDANVQGQLLTMSDLYDQRNTGVLMTGVEVAQHMSTYPVLMAKFQKMFAGTTSLEIEIQTLGSKDVMFLNLFFPIDILETLTQTDAALIRPLDVYSVMKAWASSRMGANRPAVPPLYMMPLRQISSKMPKGSVPRVSKDLSIMVTEQSSMWYLPPEHDTVGQYESEMMRYLERDNGEYCAVSTSGGGGEAPQGGLVLLDWPNLKMTYVGSTGGLVTQDLSQCRAATPANYLDLLNRRAYIYLNWLVGLVANICADTLKQPLDLPSRADLTRDAKEGNRPNGDDGMATLMLRDLVNKGFFAKPEDIKQVTIAEFMSLESVSPYVKSFRDGVRKVLDYAENSVQNLYTRYSFSTISPMLGSLYVIEKKSAVIADLKAEVAEDQKAYEDTKFDPKYPPPPVPYINEGKIALQPHQVRIASRMKASPKFAILAVDAGGGKTISGIYDYLKELDAGNVKRGLILCPAHLVAQYVKEFLYVTRSRINVIAVTTDTIKSHGIQGLVDLVKTAPPNTVVVTDYNLARGNEKTFQVSYGSTISRAYPLVDALRQFNFDWVYCDESHLLKNPKTTLNKAVSRLIADIPYKRMASGTVTPNRIQDLVAQVSLMDPTIFPEGVFEDLYSSEVDGKTIWDNVGIRAKLESRVQFIQVKRKEWAAWLPMLEEEPHYCQMSPRQQEVYNTILNLEMEKMSKEANDPNTDLWKMFHKDEVLRKAEEKRKAAQARGDSDDEEADANIEDSIESLDMDTILRPYIARLETFVANPGEDEYGKTVLSGADLISPKVAEVARICENHLREGIKGKILIFCNYHYEVDGIYNALPPALKAQTIRYEASRKAADAAKFEKDDRYQIMIGVEVSMNTGLNLQFCSRLIRCSSVWTPGALEQGNARILRPNSKTAETRDTVFIDWVVCEKSIDILKQAFLFTKFIDIGKFEEAGNPRFDQLEVPSKVSMSLDFIRTSTTLDSSDIMEINEAYGAFKHATFAEYREYRQKNLDEAGPDGRPIMTELARAPNDKDAKLMYRVPYVPGLDLFAAEDLGLVRYDQFLHIDESELMDESESPTQRDMNAAKKAMENAKAVGLGVHTEYGEGTIVKVNKTEVIVEFGDGTRRNVHKLATFIITRKQTNNVDLRSALLKQSGEVPFDAPRRLTVPASDLKSRKKQVEDQAQEARKPTKTETSPGQRKQAELRGNLSLVVMNDWVGLQFGAAAARPDVAQYLEANGFTSPQPFYYAYFPTPRHLYNQFVRWQEAGMKVDPAYSAACADLYEKFKLMPKKVDHFVGLSTQAAIKNFFRLNIKPNADKKTICPYPLVTDGDVMVAMPVKGHPGSANAVTKTIPGVKWRKAETDALRMRFFPNLVALDICVKELLNDGFVIKNIDDLRERRSTMTSRAKKLKHD